MNSSNVAATYNNVWEKEAQLVSVLSSKGLMTSNSLSRSERSLNAIKPKMLWMKYFLG